MRERTHRQTQPLDEQDMYHVNAEKSTADMIHNHALIIRRSAGRKYIEISQSEEICTHSKQGSCTRIIDITIRSNIDICSVAAEGV